MGKKVISERFATSAIYLIFSLMVFAFLVFWYSAYNYRAQGGYIANPEMIPAPVKADPNEWPLATRLAPEAVGKHWPDVMAAEAASLPEEALAQPEPASTFPTIKLPPQQEGDIPQMDVALVEAELERLMAMGFTFPQTLTPEYSGVYYATAYCCEVYPHICGGNGVTASGTVPTPGLTCAADWGVLPKGTWLYIEGVGIRRVEDTGSAIKGGRLDIAIDTHDNALRWRGVGNHQVWVLADPGFRAM